MVEMVALGALEARKMPLWPEFQHPGSIFEELKIYDPWKYDKVYIYSLRTNRRVVIQSLQFCPGNSTVKSNWKVTPLGKHLVA